MVTYSRLRSLATPILSTLANQNSAHQPIIFFRLAALPPPRKLIKNRKNGNSVLKIETADLKELEVEFTSAISCFIASPVTKTIYVGSS